MILITPPYAHAVVLSLVRAGQPEIVTDREPGAHDDTGTGMQVWGVRTPSAADVADATIGFARLEHIPNGEMLRYGTISVVVAAAE